MDIVALGELLIDFTTEKTNSDGYPTMDAHPGGAPANFLAAAAKYGAKTALLGKVGEDAFGGLLVDTLKKAGVETKGIRSDSQVFTTLAFVTIDETGNRFFSFARKPGADTQLHFEELELDLIDSCRDFHFGTISLTAEPSKTATQKAVAYAKSKGKWISFDPNLRLPLWPNRSAAKLEMLWGLTQADIVKISDEETVFLWGQISPEEVAAKLHREGVSIVFVTLGAKGAYYSGNGASGYVKSAVEVHPVDTTGAGDIFGGSALSQLLKTGKAFSALTGEELATAAAFACTAASLSTEAFGGISSVPEPEKVQEKVERHAV